MSALKDLKITLLDKKLSKEEHVGGVIVYSADKKIFIENTLAKRLQIAYKKDAPEVAALLF